MSQNFLKPIEDIAAGVMDGVAGLLNYGGGTKLRTAPEDGRVTLPDDLFAKPDVQTEWWYYTGHCEWQSGQRFGFELVFFKRRTDLDRIGIVPMTALANPMYFAHFAISRIDEQKFEYEVTRSFGMPFDVPVTMSTTSCDVRLGEWTLREVAGRHILHATLRDGFVFDAVLEPEKPLVLNGDGGISLKKGGASNHFSFTRMSVAGQTVNGGIAERFTGNAWMDREFGIWEQGNWDWFSMQFDDRTELMIYQFPGELGEIASVSTGTFVEEDGTCRYLKPSDFDIEALATWTSERTGAVYPSRWRVTVPSLGVDVEIEPSIPDQELDTRGSTMIVYWEGACGVTGTRHGNTIAGRAYVELVGYDRSHERAGLADFLFGAKIKQMREMFA